MRMTALSALQAALERDAYRTGRSDGQYAARKSYGDWDAACRAQYDAGYAFGTAERAARPQRFITGAAQ